MTFVYESENRYNVFFGLIEPKNSDVCTFIPEEKSRRLSGNTPFNILTGTARARIFKLLMSPRIDSKESIPTAYIAWRAGTTTLFLLGS